MQRLVVLAVADAVALAVERPVVLEVGLPVVPVLERPAVLAVERPVVPGSALLAEARAPEAALELAPAVALERR